MHMPEPWRLSQANVYGHIDLLPTRWLARWRNPDPTPRTDGGAGRAEVDMDSFWEILQRDGLREPILMRVCARTGHGRLETGNHRCWLAEQKGVTSLPCIVEIAEGPINQVQNGDHVFDLRPELIGFEPRRQPYPIMTAPRYIFQIAAPARSQASAVA